jgi:hypothetical protein
VKGFFQSDHLLIIADNKEVINEVYHVLVLTRINMDRNALEIFLPAFAMVFFGLVPFWARIRSIVMFEKLVGLK